MGSRPETPPHPCLVLSIFTAHRLGLKPLVSPTDSAQGSITATEGLLLFLFHGYRF